MGGEGRQEQLALGAVPNVASRIQGLAEPNTLSVSETTYRLVQGYFECQALGAQTLRGVAEPLNVYRVLTASGAQNRLDIVSTRGLTPLVGREQEVGLLLERWAQVKAGHGHVVLLTGDAGIGKSRLVQVLKDHVANEPHVRWECRSLEYYQNTALFPLVELFQRLLQFQAEDTPDEKLGKLEHALSQYRIPVEDTVPLFAPLLALPVPEHRYPLLNLSPQRQRQKTLETIVAILLELAERQLVLFILEDLHWTDPSTLELLGLLLDQTPTASLLVLLTCRPYFQPSWSHKSYLSEVTVHRLSHTQVEQIVAGITDGKTFPVEVLQQIIAKTDGVPLFVEEMTKAILESGQLKALDGHYELIGSLATLAIPATLQDSLMARLDRLVTAKGVAQMGATIGRQFAYDLLQAVSQLAASTLQRELGRLVEAELVYQRGMPPQSTYVFKHALIQDAAYESLLKSTRQQYHQRIAQVLEEHFPETTQTQPELLAHHCTEAGLLAQAVGYWHKAGQRASERSALVEAIVHCTKGLKVLQMLPVTRAHAQDELKLHIILGSALQMTQGYAAPEVERVYTRAHALCEQVGEPAQHIEVLLGLRYFHQVKGDLQTAWQIGQHLLPLLEQVHDPVLTAEVCHAVGHTLYYRGAFATARMHLERGIAIQQSLPYRTLAASTALPDFRFFGYSYTPLAWTLWYLGYPDQALVHMHTALALAQEDATPSRVEPVLAAAALLHQLRGEGERAHAYIARAMAIATEQGFRFRFAFGATLSGWVLGAQGHVTEGIAQMSQGLAVYQTTGAQMSQSWFLALLAMLHGRAGQWDDAQKRMAEAMAALSAVGQSCYQAEVHRLKGELLLQQSSDNATEAETCFHHALDIARNQQAKSLELRAAMSLAHLWQQQGKRQEAYNLLAPVYNWFTEGFATADLQESKALLDELA
jgi:predicted ATPase